MSNSRHDAFQHSLQQSLGAAYRIERELGGGGMSRVFLAEEVRFGRRVVVKVLTPELSAGVSAERFEREVLLAATLQEPHIVPVLSAGDADGIPYYTMPFIDGLSLRERIGAGALPPELALSVLRNVVAALVYAHARGIVHRDIKPENVLLSGSTAVVTDFGIAKALLDAREGTGATAPTLTATGTSLGSPAYMAPEQAAGDAVDVRADLYAWGVMAYELLAGAHPFAAQSTAQKMIVAHLTVQPSRLATVNTAVSAPLSDLVMQCLAKNPDDRPASAAAIESTLGAMLREGSVSTSAPRVRRWKRTSLATFAGLFIVIAGGYALIPAELKAAIRTLSTRAEPVYRVRRAVVAPLVNETGDPRLDALGAMASDAITTALSRLSSLETVDSRTVAATANVVEGIPRLFRPSAERAIAAETGAGVLVTGSYFLVGDSVQFRTRVVNSATGAVLQSLPLVNAASASPTTAMPVLAQRVASVLRSAADSEFFIAANSFSSTTSMEAYEALRAAASSSGDSTTLSLVRRALTLDSLYGSAMSFLPNIAHSLQKFALADSALERAERLRDRMSPFEQANVDGLVAVRNGDLAGVLRASTRELSTAPYSDLTKASVVSALLASRQPRRALEIMRSMQPDRGILLGGAEYWLSLAYAHAQLGDLRQALAAAQEADRRVPGASATRTEAAVLGMLGDTTGVNEALGRISKRYAWGVPRFAASAAALLANRDSPDALAVAKRFADGWRERGSANGVLAFPIGRLGLLTLTERWAPLLALTDSLRALPDMDTLNVISRLRIDAARAIAYAHLGQRAKALAIDSALTAFTDTRWLKGAVPQNRARIAAHLGDSARAVQLLEEALQQAMLTGAEGVGTVGSDPYLLPLRRYAQFRALMKPSAADGSNRSR